MTIVWRVGCDDARRIHILMDHRANRLRFEKQTEELKLTNEDISGDFVAEQPSA